jgi:hypothetical protein
MTDQTRRARGSGSDKFCACLTIVTFCLRSWVVCYMALPYILSPVRYLAGLAPYVARTRSSLTQILPPPGLQRFSSKAFLRCYSREI